MRDAGTRGWIGGLALASMMLLAACGPPPATVPSESAAATEPGEVVADAGWLKGQLHLHSNVSGDSETPPADVVRWYAEHGFDFIVFTDHDRITEVPAPAPASAGGQPPMLVIPGIELTQNLERCEPPPEPGLQCLLHVNGLFVGNDTSVIGSVPAPTGIDRLELYAHAIAVTEALGGVALLNHPNFHYAADADLVAALAGRGLSLLEIANEAVDSNNEGDRAHPSTEALWDAVLSTGARVWGVATDDAHHYYDARQVRDHGRLAHVGNRGWVMVRAERSPAAIRAALQRGEFYASNGVTLREVAWDGERLRIAVDDASEGVHRFTFIGDGGKVLERQRGREATFGVPRGHHGYVRAVVEDPQGRKAWVQPVWSPTSEPALNGDAARTDPEARPS
ncbi:CehA/McbA family metallohydrolase [Paraliomyxa miuraensis]|uniref:CehA/McbA family metallohydrolase n=1 Tax=Paraliomyxa miuraensis TaxID=376150 RepID=UPI00225928BC|nr:CehA/McbA family metallohydrolase [Paraliomyxa miuraensis]MCX4241861.1 CehA/McbA family metallohydrolase [Paraliomyxa miuraensis]